MTTWEKRRRAKRARMMRRGFYAALIVWFILGIVGLITVIQWFAGAVMGIGPRAYGKDMAKDRPSETIQTESGDGGADETEEDTGGLQGKGTLPAGSAEYAFSEEERLECQRLCKENPELLVLVNKETELDSRFDSRLRNICNGRLQASDWMYQDLVDMLAAARREGYQYWIASAYRSRARQQELIDEDVNRFMAEGMSYQEALAETLTETMPAGHSEHETGLALDILCSGNEEMDISQAREPGNHWMVTHCAEYGFILRYPEDKVGITEIAYEPWHFRYVGKEAAKFMMERGITLEEFWAGAR